jgi:Fe-S cluster biogenesis protein NfuA
MAPETTPGTTPESTPESTKALVEKALEICRPALALDRGGIELVRVTGEGIAELRFTGACAECPLSRMTLRAGIERVVLRHAPEIRRVEQIA